MMLWDDELGTVETGKNLEGDRVTTEYNVGMIVGLVVGLVFWMGTIWLAATYGEKRRARADAVACAETAALVTEYVRDDSRALALTLGLAHALETMRDEPEPVYEVQP